MTKQKIVREKKVVSSEVENLLQAEHYGTYLRAGIDSDMERDRQLLMLASLAIGVLMGIFDTDDLSGMFAFILWLTASISFTLCIIATLVLFPKNSAYFKGIIEKDRRAENLKKGVERISFFASITFICGIIAVFALVVAESKFLVKKDEFAVEKVEQMEQEVQPDNADENSAEPSVVSPQDQDVPNVQL